MQKFITGQILILIFNTQVMMNELCPIHLCTTAKDPIFCENDAIFLMYMKTFKL